MIPDSSLWDSLNVDIDILYWLYNRDLPITCVSYWQVQAYCLFRTQMENIYLKKRIPKDYELRVLVRLPTPEEWESLTKIKNESSRKAKNTKLKGISKKEHRSLFNCIDCNFSNPPDTLGNFVNPTSAWYFSEKSASNPLHHLYGNAAEMTSEFGVAKGGSYKDYYVDLKPEKIQHYTHAENWLGFRCIVEIVIRKKE